MARQQKQTEIEASVSTDAVKPLFDCVAGYLDANDWHYSSFEDKGYFSMGCRIKEATVRVIIDVTELDEWRRVMVYVSYPIFVSEQKRAAIAESISRINYRTTLGNLEMDFVDGEVRVRTTLEVNTEFSDSMIENVLNTGLRTADRFFAPIMAVVFGNASPDKVIEMAENPSDVTLQ